MTASPLPRRLVASSLSLSFLYPRHFEISSEALAEAKCAGLALSDPCLRRPGRRVLGRGVLQGLVIRMKFQSALNFWYFCFKTKVQKAKPSKAGPSKKIFQMGKIKFL